MTIMIATAIRGLATLCFFTLTLVSTTIVSAAETYRFDKAHTEIRFSWSHFGLTTMSARILEYDGALHYDKNAPERSKLDVKLHADSLWTSSKEVSHQLQGADFFDAANYPEITFTTTKVEKISDTTAKIYGNLTVKDITKPVILRATLHFEGHRPDAGRQSLGVSARTILKRSDFNIDKYAPVISDEVEITIETEMDRDS